MTQTKPRRRRVKITLAERTAIALEAKAASRNMTVEAFIAQQLDLAEQEGSKTI